MAEISAALVKELRDQTGAPMMDCKRALQETNAGPLSEDGLRDLVEHVLALTKRELG